jgi:hypothetical protein
VISYEICASAETHAPPERIFAVLDDFGRWPDWMPSFERIRVELPPAATPALGYRFRLRSGVVHTDMEVIDFTPLSRATAFKISFPPLSGVNRCQVVPLSGGRSRLERVDVLHLPDLVAHIIDTTQRQRFERLAGEFLRALKRTVETDVGPSVPGAPAEHAQ